MRGTPWTEDEIEMLRKLHADGLSTSQISVQLNRVSRDSVLCKIRKLGLSEKLKRERTRGYGSISAAFDRYEDWYARGATHPQHIINAARRPPPVWNDRHQIVPTDTAVALFDLRYGVCRMPVGNHDGPVDGRLFCGALALTKSSYCESCYRIAYTQRVA